MKDFIYISYTYTVFNLRNLDYSILDQIEILHLFDYPDYNILQDTRKKIVFVDWWQYSIGIDTYKKPLDFSWADLVICITPEIAVENWEVYNEKTKKLLKNNNVIYCVGGNSLNYDSSADRLYSPFLYHFMATAKINQLIEYRNSQRTFLFDALLGTKKEHRISIFNFLKKEKLLDRSLVSIFDNPWHLQINSLCPSYKSTELNKFDSELFLSFQKSKNCNFHTSEGLQLRYKQRLINVNLSYMISPEIYQNSWYSIVAETNFKDFHFFTEKTAKCFLAKRIFVLFAAPKSLEKLKEIGFKTFNNIIDESYDNEYNHRIRMNKALEQIKRLSQSDPMTLYSAAEKILDHNYNMLMNTDLGITEVNNFIKNHIDKL